LFLLGPDIYANRQNTDSLLSIIETTEDDSVRVSANEKKLCAFLRLNMSTKEISAITYQSINSITVARSRLRKKLDIESDESLISFLKSM
jgi:DNA-binding CsgD family transcriptional regulator